MNNNIAFVGDMHIQFSNPTSRVDNYFESVLNKLSQILDNNRVVISLGDMFSNPVLDIQGTLVLIELLKRYKDKGGMFFEIAGNHTIYNWNLNTLSKTTLGLLHKLELVNILDRSGLVVNSLDKLELEGITIVPGLLNNPHDVIKAPTDNSIMVAHTYYNFSRDPKHSFEYEEIANLGYRAIFLGHDHERYPEKVLEQGVLYRPGSLGREAAHPYNFTRELIYYKLDLDTDSISPVKIDYLPASEVFSLEVIEKHNDTTSAFIYDLEELMKNFKNKSSISVSIKKMMEDNPEISDEIISFIEDCHEACQLEFV